MNLNANELKMLDDFRGMAGLETWHRGRILTSHVLGPGFLASVLEKERKKWK